MIQKSKLPSHLFLRVIFLILGLFFIAFGVALSTKSGLGVSPSAAIPFVLCRVTPLTMGQLTTIINLLMIVVQIVLLRRNYKPVQLLQLLVVFLFGYFTDLTLFLVKNLTIENYILRLLLCVASCIIMGLGVYLEVKANLITMSSEGAINAIVKIFHTDFGKTKMGLDCTLVAIGVILSFIYLHSLQGVREGTIIAALLVGMCVQRYNHYFHFIDRLLNTVPAAKVQEDSSTDYPLVITIERELGTGGYEIGQALAKEFHIPFYDHNYISKAAVDAGLTSEEMEHTGDQLPTGLLYNMYSDGAASSHNIAMQDSIFAAQSSIIQELASKESCVIVGRLASYVLKNRPNSFHIFISANHEFRAKRIENAYNLSHKKALQLVRNEDIARANHCSYLTEAPWGLSKHYSLTLDSSVYGIEGSIELIKDALRLSNHS